jgi:hypothetical protein
LEVWERSTLKKRLGYVGASHETASEYERLLLLS